MGTRIEDIGNAEKRAFVAAWCDLPQEKRNQDSLTELAMDIFDLKGPEEAFEKGISVLETPRVKHIVKITLERQGLATNEKLEKWADTAGEFLEDTVHQAAESDDWKNKKVGVEAAKSLLSNFTRATIGGPKDKLEYIREQLSGEARELFDKDPKALMAEAGEIDAVTTVQ